MGTIAYKNIEEVKKLEDSFNKVLSQIKDCCLIEGYEPEDFDNCKWPLSTVVLQGMLVTVNPDNFVFEICSNLAKMMKVCSSIDSRLCEDNPGFESGFVNDPDYEKMAAEWKTKRPKMIEYFKENTKTFDELDKEIKQLANQITVERLKSSIDMLKNSLAKMFSKLEEKMENLDYVSDKMLSSYKDTIEKVKDVEEKISKFVDVEKLCTDSDGSNGNWVSIDELEEEVNDKEYDIKERKKFAYGVNRLAILGVGIGFGFKSPYNKYYTKKFELLAYNDEELEATIESVRKYVDKDKEELDKLSAKLAGLRKKINKLNICDEKLSDSATITEISQFIGRAQDKTQHENVKGRCKFCKGELDSLHKTGVADDFVLSNYLTKTIDVIERFARSIIDLQNAESDIKELEKKESEAKLEEEKKEQEKESEAKLEEKEKEQEKEEQPEEEEKEEENEKLEMHENDSKEAIKKRIDDKVKDGEGNIIFENGESGGYGGYKSVSDYLEEASKCTKEYLSNSAKKDFDKWNKRYNYYVSFINDEKWKSENFDSVIEFYAALIDLQHDLKSLRVGQKLNKMDDIEKMKEYEKNFKNKSRFAPCVLKYMNLRKMGDKKSKKAAEGEWKIIKERMESLLDEIGRLTTSNLSGLDEYSEKYTKDVSTEEERLEKKSALGKFGHRVKEKLFEAYDYVVSTPVDITLDNTMVNLFVNFATEIKGLKSMENVKLKDKFKTNFKSRQNTYKDWYNYTESKFGDIDKCTKGSEYRATGYQESGVNAVKIAILYVFERSMMHCKLENLNSIREGIKKFIYEIVSKEDLKNRKKEVEEKKLEPSKNSNDVTNIEAVQIACSQADTLCKNVKSSTADVLGRKKSLEKVLKKDACIKILNFIGKKHRSALKSKLT